MLDNPILLVAPGRSAAAERLTAQVSALGGPVPQVVTDPQVALESFDADAPPQALIDLRDLQTLLELAGERLTLIDRFQEQVEMKSRLVAVVAHEFRNPLNAILFSSELLQRYGGEVSREKRESYFQRIHAAVNRMNLLLDDVLVIGETDAGKLICAPHPMDLVDFCREVIDELQTENDGIAFTMQSSHPMSVNSRICLDEKLLRHILINLLGNAIKYSPKGAEVTFNLLLGAETAVFRIQDQGIGIPEVDRGQLFTAFFRGSNVKRIPGTGLGLSIVKHCVEVQGGEVMLESQPGHGSVFTVTLPIEWVQVNEKDSSY
jgi:signal transduction histidine kinase